MDVRPLGVIPMSLPKLQPNPFLKDMTQSDEAPEGGR